MKPVVQYTRNTLRYIGVGARCFLEPIDHPDKGRVSDCRLVMTSPVIGYNREHAIVETRNTLYVPAER